MISGAIHGTRLLLEILKDIKVVKEEVHASSSMDKNQFNVNERLDSIEAKLKATSEFVESIEALAFKISNVEKATARLMRII